MQLHCIFACVSPAGMFHLRTPQYLLHSHSSAIRFSIRSWAPFIPKQDLYFLLCLPSQVFHKITTDGICTSHACCSLCVTLIQSANRGGTEISHSGAAPLSIFMERSQELLCCLFICFSYNCMMGTRR